MNCVNHNDPKVIEFSKLLNKRPEAIAAVFGVWQDQNNNYSDFPDLEVTKQLLTKSISSIVLKRIISGGQTGGDLGGLEGGREAGLETGGTAPPGWISGSKSEQKLLESYGLKEGEKDPSTYPKRTMKNVDDSDGTLAIMWGPSVGTSKTIGYAQTHKWQHGNAESKDNGYKPVLVINHQDSDQAAQELADFIKRNNIQTLNVAGHREKSQPGIQKFTKELIIKTKKLLEKPTQEMPQLNLKIIEGDIWNSGGIPIITTNLGGVHGAGLANQAYKKGFIEYKKHGEFGDRGKVITFPVKKVWSDKTNLSLLKESADKLIKLANDNPDKKYTLPLIGLGHGEGNVNEILPVIKQILEATNNVQLILPTSTTNRGKQGTARTDNSLSIVEQVKKELTSIQEVPQIEEPETIEYEALELKRESRPGQIIINNKILTEVETKYLLDGLTFYYTKALFSDAKTIEKFITPNEKGERTVTGLSLDDIRTSMASSLDDKISALTETLELLEEDKKANKVQIESITDDIDHLQFIVKQVLGFDSDENGVFNVDLGAPANFKTLYEKFKNKLDLIGLKEVKDSQEQFTELSGSDSMVNIPAMYLDPKKSMSATIRLLLGSIPQVNEQGSIIHNSFGLPKMTDANTSFNRLAWHLTENLPQGNFEKQREKIIELSKKHPEYLRLLNQLGETTPGSSIPSEMLRTQFTVTFSQTKLKFLTALIDDGIFKIQDANKETAANRIVSSWRANYWAQLANKEEWDKTLSQIQANMKELNSIKTMNSRAKLLANTILTDLGLAEVSDETLSAKYTGGDIRTTLDEIVKRGLKNPYLFWTKGNADTEILGRINEIVQTEAKYTKSATDLQFLDESGKPVYGVTLNTYLTNLGQEINHTVENNPELLDTEFGWLVNDNFNQEGLILKHIKSGQKIEFGVIKSLSSSDGKTRTSIAQGDVGTMISADMIAAFQGKNLPPITGDRETKSYWSIGEEPLLPFGSAKQEAAKYLVNHLKAELMTATDETNREILYMGKYQNQLRLLKDVFTEENIPGLNAELTKTNLTKPEVDAFVQKNYTKLLQVADTYLTNFSKNINDELTKLGFSETFDLKSKDPNKVDKNGKRLKIPTNIDTPTTIRVGNELKTITYREATDFYSYLRLVALIESQKFFFGDPAEYKSADDAFKRYSLFTATKQIARTDESHVKWLNAHGYNLETKNPTIPVWVVNDPVHDGTLDEAIQEMYKIQEAQIRKDVASTDLSKETQERLVATKMNSLKAAYDNFKKADSQGWMNPKTARLIKMIHGQWTNLDEEIYEKYLKPDKFNPENPETYLPTKFYPRISPVKTQHVGPMADYKNKYVTTSLKHSLLRLTPELVHNKRFSELLDVVEILFDGVALVQTLSGVKMGARLNSKKEIDELFNENGTVNQNPESVHRIYLKYIGEQQNLEPKNKVEGTVGGQQRRFHFQDIYEQGKTIDKKLQTLATRYEDTQIELFERQWNEFLTDSGISTLRDKKGNLVNYYIPNTQEAREKLVNSLLDVVSKRQVSNNVIEAIERFIDEKMLLDAAPGKRKLESLFLAPIREALSREYRNGGMRVLAAYTGLESIKEDPGLAWYKYNGENQQVTPAEVILPPAYGQTVNIGDKILFFRIPSTGVASIDIVTVKAFAPVGDVIFASPHLLPKTNADHDVDKVIMFLPNYKNGKYVDSNGDSIEALQNRMLELSEQLILHPKRFKALTTPVGDGVISAVGKELGYVTKDKTEIHELKNPLVNHFKGEQFHGGKTLISNLSIYATQSPLKQKVNLYWNIPVDKFHVFFDYKTTEINGVKYPSMANLLDTQGNRISELFTEMTQHSLDVQNNPTISQLGINSLTLPGWAAMTDIGVTQEGLFRLINHPIVQKYIAFKKKNFRPSRDRGDQNYQPNLKSGTESLIRAFLNQNKLNLKYDDLISTLEYKLERLSPDQEQEKQELQDKINKRDEYLREFRKTHTFEKDKGTLITGFDERVFEEYLELERLGKWFNKLALSSRPDADAVGSTSIEGFKETINARNGVIQSGKFGNIDKLFKETFLRPAYEHSHALFNTYDKYILALSESPINEQGKTVAERMREIKNQLKGWKTKTEAIDFSNKLDDELLVAILMKTPQLSYVNTIDLLLENSNRKTVGQLLAEYQKPSSSIKDNPFIKMLVPVTQSNLSNIILAQRTMDAETQNEVTNGFEELLSSTDPNIRKFASDYVRFAIVQAGFGPSYYNLINTIPTLTLTNLVLDIYDRFLKQSNKESFFDGFVNELIKQDPLNMTNKGKRNKHGDVEMDTNHLPYVWMRNKDGLIYLLERTGWSGTGFKYESTETTPQANQTPREIKTYWAPEKPVVKFRNNKNVTNQEAEETCFEE